MQNSQNCNIKSPCSNLKSKENIPKFPSKAKFKLGKSLTTWITNYYTLLLCCPTNYFIPLTLLYVCILLLVSFFHKTQKKHNNGDNEHDHNNNEHNEFSFGSLT